MVAIMAKAGPPDPAPSYRSWVGAKIGEKTLSSAATRPEASNDPWLPNRRIWANLNEPLA